ncbi:hypothetical protein [Limisphaera sp. 4302-co]
MELVLFAVEWGPAGRAGVLAREAGLGQARQGRGFAVIRDSW